MTNSQTEQTNNEKVETLVSEYFHKHQESPFKDFHEKEDNQMAVDLDSDFEKELVETFGDKTSEVLGEYISDLIRNITDNLSEDDLKELKELKEINETEPEPVEGQELKDA